MMPGTGISAPLANENLRRDLSSGVLKYSVFSKIFLEIQKYFIECIPFRCIFHNKRHGEIQWVP